MKEAWKILVAGLVLSAVLLAGVATAQGGTIQVSKSGDVITITGHTNLASGDRLLINVVSAGFTPTEKGSGGGFAGAGGTVVVQRGSPLNTYTFDVNVSAFPPGTYLITVESVETGFSESASFVLPLATVTETQVAPTNETPGMRAAEPTTFIPASPSPLTTVPAPKTSPTTVPVMEITTIAGIVIAIRALLRG